MCGIEQLPRGTLNFLIQHLSYEPSSKDIFISSRTDFEMIGNGERCLCLVPKLGRAELHCHGEVG